MPAGDDDELADRILGRGFLEPGDLEPASTEPVAPGTGSRYEILEKAGGGGSGEVFKARDKELGRIVALKRVRLGGGALDAETIARFRKEAQALAALHHPGIPAVHDTRTVGREAFVVMEYVEGASLHDLLREGKLSPEERVRIVEEVARIVHFAHEKGFVHRDLKPANILVGVDGRARVIDFGIARHLSAQGAERLTQTGEILGTPHFMSPEQALGKSHEVDARSDVFSLGSILYFALSGQLPFDAKSALAVAAAVAKSEPVPLRKVAPGVAAPLEAVVRRAMSRERADRHPTALALALELRSVRGRRAARRTLAFVALAAFSIAGGVGLALLGPAKAPPEVRAPDPPPPPPPSPPPRPPVVYVTDKLDELDARVAERLKKGDDAATEKVEKALDRALADLEAAGSGPR